MMSSIEEIVRLIPGCISCDILTGKITAPGGVIYENEYWHVDSVVSPVYWRGFLIVKLKRHCEHLAELTSKEAESLGPVVKATCSALGDVLHPEKVYVCSFGDGIKHIHLWVLPRFPEMRPGMHWVLLNLNFRALLTLRLGIKKWVCSDEEVAEDVRRLRECINQFLQ
jgi:diadenosine tetraphosphate (Ap4A) HIT family hydrolase